jgi:hypothetical protein
MPNREESTISIPNKNQNEDLVDEDLVEEEIDERILNILGLKDVFDIDYGTYRSLLKEKSVLISMGKSNLPREEEMLIQEEFKRVRKKSGRFKPKSKKINSEVFFGRKSKNENDADTFKPKALLPPSNLKKIEGDSEEDIKKEKSDNVLDFLKGDFLKELQSIRETVESIAENLKKQYEIEKNKKESLRKQSEVQKGKSKESALEEKESKTPKLIEKITKPFTSLFDTIKNFLLNVLLGTAAVWLISIFQDPQKILKPIQGVLNGIFGFFNNIIQWIDNTVVDPIRKFIDNVNLTIKSFIDQVNSALKFIPGSSPITAPNIPNIPNAPTITAPNITGPPVQKSASGGIVRKYSGGGHQNQTINNNSTNIQTSHSDGYVTKDTGVEVSGMGKDTQLTALSPGEFVLVPGAVNEFGIDNLKVVNQKYGGTNQPQVTKLKSSNIFGMSGGGLVDTLGGFLPGTGNVMAPRSSGPRDIRGNQQTDPGFQSKFLGIPLGSPTSGASSRFGMTAPLGPGGDVGGYTKEQKKRYASRTGSSFVPTSYAGSISGAMGDSHLRFPGLPSLQNKKIEIPDYMMPSNTRKSQSQTPRLGSGNTTNRGLNRAIQNARDITNMPGGGAYKPLVESAVDSSTKMQRYYDNLKNVMRGAGMSGNKESINMRGQKINLGPQSSSQPSKPLEIAFQNKLPRIPGKREQNNTTIIPFPLQNKKKSSGNSVGAKSTPKVTFSSTDPNNMITTINSAIYGLVG